ncbi:MAG: type II toxin-antitoxin system HicA family toxin [Vulcanimicrobiaceae bacterium]
MSRLPQIRPSRLVQALRRAGFEPLGQHGSHLALRRGPVKVIVPMHAGQDVPPGTLRDILKRANLTADDLRDLL